MTVQTKVLPDVCVIQPEAERAEGNDQPDRCLILSVCHTDTIHFSLLERRKEMERG